MNSIHGVKGIRDNEINNLKVACTLIDNIGLVVIGLSIICNTLGGGGGVVIMVA